LNLEKEALMNIRVEFEINVSIDNNQKIGIENLTNSIAEMELNKLVTREIVEECQELLVDELCNPKYSRNGEKEHKRAGKSKRPLEVWKGRPGAYKSEKPRKDSQAHELIELDGKKLKGHILHRDRSSYQAYLRGL
jgi:hypothetical protein